MSACVARPSDAFGPSGLAGLASAAAYWVAAGTSAVVGSLEEVVGTGPVVAAVEDMAGLAVAAAAVVVADRAAGVADRTRHRAGYSAEDSGRATQYVPGRTPAFARSPE